MTKRKSQVEGDAVAVQDVPGEEIRPWREGDPLAGDEGGETKVKEPKDVKFRRLANSRVPKALKAIQTVSMLFNRLQYEWTEEEAARVIDALDGQIKDMRQLAQGKKARAAGWSL